MLFFNNIILKRYEDHLAAIKVHLYQDIIFFLRK